MREIIIHCDRCGELIDNSVQTITIENSLRISLEYEICHKCSQKLNRFFKAFWEKQKSINNKIE